MSSGKKWRVMPLAAATTLVLGLAACGGDDGGSDTGGSGGGSSKAGKIGVILPETTTSPRWEANDRPALKKAFDDADIESDIQNAAGDKAKFGTICDSMINEGVTILIITNVDSDSGAACLKKAAQSGIKGIDYDRLTLGGGAAYYVSFDNVKVGELMGQGLEKCLADLKETKDAGVVYINGAPTDNNAALFKQGYDTYLKGLTGKVKILSSDQSGQWDTTKAGLAFDGLYTQFKSQIKGVISANDTMATGVIASLKRNGLAGKVPVTGQDASVAGLQQILSGSQCMTVYKNVALEADAVSKLAIAMAKGDASGADALATATVKDTTAGTDIKSSLVTPQAIFADSVKTVISDGYQKAADVCTTEFADACKKYGVS